MVTTKTDVISPIIRCTIRFLTLLHFCKVSKTVWLGGGEKQTVNVTKSTRKAASAASPQSPLPSPLDAHFLSLSLFFIIFLFFVSGNLLRLWPFIKWPIKREVSINAC